MVADRSERRLILEDSVPPPWVGQRMTLEQFLALPAVKPNLEFTDGLVTQKMAAKPTHGSLQQYLAAAFNQFAGPRRLGLAFTETRFVTPTWAPVPDVSYYRRGRVHRRGKRPPSDFHEPPDIAVEIVSPGQSVTELIKKCLRFTALGSQVALLVDPDEETVLAFRLGQPLQLLQGDDPIRLEDILPGFSLIVRDMFDALAPDWLDEADEASDAASTPDA
jgi:Uma2 family endonuclease